MFGSHMTLLWEIHFMHDLISGMGHLQMAIALHLHISMLGQLYKFKIQKASTGSQKHQQLHVHM